MIARKSGGKWYVAGINAQDEPLSLDLDLTFLGGGDATVYSDGDNGGVNKNVVALKSTKKGAVNYSVQLPSQKGFVIVK